MVKQERNQELYIVAHDIRSLYNVGSLFRLSDGAGITKLFLTGVTGAPFDRVKYQRQRQQIAKTALEGLNNVTWEYAKDPMSIIDQMKKNGAAIVALEQTSNSQPYHQVAYPDKLCIILGNEVDGVDRKLLDRCDLVAELPMYGAGKSLNVISAASILVYHIRHSGWLSNHK